MTRYQFPYRGMARTSFSKRFGKHTPLSQRAFTPPASALGWTVDDQAWAVEHWFFVERVEPANRVELVALPHRQRTDLDICNELEQRAFHGDRTALKALCFIQQQDEFGWSGVWEKPCLEKRTHALLWYKELVEARRLEHYEQLARRAELRSKTAERAVKAAARRIEHRSAAKAKYAEKKAALAAHNARAAEYAASFGKNFSGTMPPQ